MARHISYQFDWGFATYDHDTEQDRIDEIEAAGTYIDKFPVTIQERELIDDSNTLVEVIGGELTLTPGSGS